jgi:dihydroorotate dehydrogenase subfamily 1
MTRVRTRLFDIALPSPILLAAGPLSELPAQIKNAFAAGAGAVVTKTIYLGQMDVRRERICRERFGTFNSTTYSRRSIDDWLRDLEEFARMGLPVIANIHADSEARLGQLVRKVASTGVPAIELGISCPSARSDDSQAFNEFVAAYTSSAREATTLPISVKLTAGEGLLSSARLAIASGASGITVSDALRGLAVDVERRRIRFCGPVGYSGAAIKPIVLHAIYQLRRAGIDCPIVGVGGIRTVSDVLEYLYVGCSAVQLLTGVMNSNVRLLGELGRGLEHWCEERDLTVSNIIGCALREGVEDG